MGSLTTTADKTQILLDLHTKYTTRLMPILHLAFAQVRNFYDDLYAMTDVNPTLVKISDQLDYPLDQILTHVRLLDKLFDDLIRPICPERYAKKKETTEFNPANTISHIAENNAKLLNYYAELELEGSECLDIKNIATEINILCVLFLQQLKVKFPHIF